MTSQSRKQPLLSCGYCKSRKRKCDRKLPKCSLCTSKYLTCSYPTPTRRHREPSEVRQAPSPQSSTAAAVRTPDAAALPTSASTSNFPAVFYLDWDIYQRCEVEKPKSGTVIPEAVSALISARWQAIAAEYFLTTHTWMPFVSKKRFYENATSTLRSDYALLILCMELSMWVPNERNPRTPAYLAAKSFYLDLEIQGVVSLQVLQAQILIALFEFGHAIYPSAVVSVDACVAYGKALGINWDADYPKKPFAWVDREEQNRVWWAIVILACVSKLGHQGHQSLVETPSSDVHLPADTAAWDRGEMPAKASSILHSLSNKDLGAFASMAEAIRLLGQVVTNVSARDAVENLHNDEAVLLDRALRALEVVVEVEGDYNALSIMNQTTICSIALLILHESHASSKSAVSDYFSSIHHAKHITNVVRKSRDVVMQDSASHQLHECVKEASPFITTLLYRAAIMSLRLDQEYKSEETAEALAVLKVAMKDFDNRWKGTGEYLKILEAREVFAM